MKTVDIIIRVPESWVNPFWAWYLDGGGDEGFVTTLEDENGIGDEAQLDWDKDKLLICHAMNKNQLADMMKQGN